MNNFCVLIPAFNEARTIGAIVKELKDKGLPVYVVDDGSSDDTAIAAGSAGAKVLKHDKNMGKGASLRDGFNSVLKEGFGSVLVMDGDGQHEVASIPDFFKVMKETGADIVIGNRMLNTASMPPLRRKVNAFMSFILSRACGQNIPDTQCGFRLIKRKVLEDVRLSSSNFEIESELIVMASRKGFKIASAAIRTVYGDETSKVNPVTDTIRFIAFLIKMRFVKNE